MRLYKIFIRLNKEMKFQVICIFLTIILIAVSVWNLTILNYLYNAYLKQSREKFENVCFLSVDVIKMGQKISIGIIVVSLLFLVVVISRLYKKIGK